MPSQNSLSGNHVPSCLPDGRTNPAYSRAYYLAHLEEIKKKQHISYLAHRDERREKRKAYYIANKSKFDIRGRLYYLKVRSLSFDRYGRECVKCGEINEGFLTLDHVNDDGAELRRKFGSNLYHWAKKNGYPDVLQTMCYNCQAMKEINRRKTSRMANFTPPPDFERWKSGPARGYCCRCRIRLTAETARPSIVRREYGLCRYCQSKQDAARAEESKREVITVLGGKCHCCGEARLDTLSVGHPNGGGKLAREEYGRGTMFYRNLLKGNEEFRSGLKVECINCNYGTFRNSGVCPHHSQIMTHSHLVRPTAGQI